MAFLRKVFYNMSCQKYHFVCFRHISHSPFRLIIDTPSPHRPISPSPCRFFAVSDTPFPESAPEVLND